MSAAGAAAGAERTPRTVVSMRALLASCAAARAVSTPPAWEPASQAPVNTEQAAPESEAA
ncbi:MULTISPECIES: hypothetical protein [unclassified Streptomyces]|uniref:hypothetical protein n=1 Tax=unclassified Streptomyces TaxID=2593676 RepID=UPI002270B771|nr:MULTISPECIES: hypothetical protein [unclassified Streptomyces]MCY0917559.1 hypothetical protein [Streptomyces sp. H27-G5]MCY0955875.1 hypothetical protein [Streptomyces sp. H27-H5]